MKTKSLPLFLAVLAAAVAGFGFWKLDRSRQQMFHTYSRLRVLQKVSAVRSALETGVNRRMELAQVLASFTTANPNVKQKEFESFVRHLAEGDTVVRSFTLARNAVITAIYPLAGSEKALGWDILKNPLERKAAERAILTKSAVLAGPVKLVEGGTAFIARVPIFAMLPKKAERDTVCWGLAGALIKTDALYRETGLSSISGSLRLALRGRDGLGAKGGPFFGDERVFGSNPVILDVHFPNGSWQLAALPIGGWLETAPGSTKFRIFGIVLTLLTGILVYPFSKSILKLF
ncbi:MAG TPA: CHASE domain-containing protein [bacterium]